MNDLRPAVVGIGATGTVLAGALLVRHPDTVLVAHNPNSSAVIQEDGLTVSGILEIKVPVRHIVTEVEALKDFNSNLIFIATKTFHFPEILEKLKKIFTPGMKIVSTHNGLGTEDLIADSFGIDAAFRMSLNLGASLKGPGTVDMAFFNKPNHLGALTSVNRDTGLTLAEHISAGGLDTEYVEDIKRYVWKKMIMKCTMASICAVTDMTIKGALENPNTREIAENCFREILAVSKAKGYDLGEEYLAQALAYLEKVGIHKDSMCVDVANKTRTEIDFLGGKVVEYARQTGVATPFYIAMTNLVRTLENSYLLPA